MDTVLSVAFVVAAVAFFKKQLGLNGGASLLCAFCVALFVGIAPTVSEQIPALSPWILSVVNVVALFLSAAGTVDAVSQFRK